MDNGVGADMGPVPVEEICLERCEGPHCLCVTGTSWLQKYQGVETGAWGCVVWSWAGQRPGISGH